jgi:ArsR family transcriptional regulator, virulence genes transcriptional regulator
MNNSSHFQPNSSSSEQEINANIQIAPAFRIDTLAMKKAALIVRSVNHKLRQSILNLLEENDKMAVTDIYVKLRIEQSVASQHLAIMRRTGFVDTTRDGKNIYYSINKDRLAHLNKVVNLMLQDYE